MSPRRRLVWETIAGFLIVASLVIATSAWVRVDRQQKRTAAQAERQCRRTILFAPYLGHYLRAHHVFPTTGGVGVPSGNVEKAYLSLLPKDC